MISENEKQTRKMKTTNQSDDGRTVPDLEDEDDQKAQYCHENEVG